MADLKTHLPRAQDLDSWFGALMQTSTLTELGVLFAWRCTGLGHRVCGWRVRQNRKGHRSCSVVASSMVSCFRSSGSALRMSFN
jgi:hypothetical protein